MKPSPRLLATIACSASLLAGCQSSDSDSSSNSSRTIPDSSEKVTLDATGAIGSAVHLDLGSGHTVTESETWHIAYQRYIGFKVNGGVSGSGNVSACLAHHFEDFYDDQGEPIKEKFEGITADETQEAFNAVNSASCTDEDFITDSLNTKIATSDWLKAAYGPQGPSFAASSEDTNGWIIQSASKDDNQNYAYGRVSVKSIESRVIVLSYEAWDANGQTFLEAVDSPELDFNTERQYWDMESNSVSHADANWEISVTADANGRDYPLQVNSTVSGNGDAGVGLVSGEGMESAFDVTDPSDPKQVYAFFADSVSGALSTPGNYGPLQYGAAGGHAMWANFATYLIKENDTGKLFKMQLISNYGADGIQTSGNLYIRYEAL